MKILFISQVFWPDTVSVAQQLWDLTQHLIESGHQVTVFSSLYPYESYGSKKYKFFESASGVKVVRLRQTNFSKKYIFGRLINIATFNFSISLRLLKINKNEFDVIVGTTAPPLLSFFGLVIARRKKIPYCCWVMDLQPELAIQSGLIRKNGVLAFVLNKMNGFVLKKSDLVIALDRYMECYIKMRRIGKICVSPVWSVSMGKYEGRINDNPFRIANKMGDKIVVMYSGNHAFIHPLDTLLEVALKLKHNENFLFVFIGDGVRKKSVANFKSRYELNNIMQLPFQPRENIHNSLAAADIQVVIIGDGQVGFTHPSKIYGALDVGRPILYIGPKPSHVDDILKNLPGNISVQHGEVALLADKLLEFSYNENIENINIGYRNWRFSKDHFNPNISKVTITNAIKDIA